MTKAKKMLSIVLAVVMVAAMFAFSASAATQNATFTVSVDNATVTQGEVINVTVNLTTDYYAGPTSVPVYYNPAVFEFVAGSVVGANIFGSAATTDVYSNNDAGTGCLKVAFIPKSSAGTATAKMMNGTLFTFQLKAIADGTSDIGLKAEDQKTATNVGGTLYCGAYASSAIDANPDTVGQVFTINNTSATVGAAATPELQLSETGAANGAVISRTYAVADGYAGCVMGVDTLDHDGLMATLSESLTTPAGSIEIDTSATGGVETTGTLIKLLDEGGTVLETYVFIYFGDVNMDGAVDSSDATSIEENEFFVTEITEEYRLLAADASGDTSPDSSDATMIEEFEFFVTEALPTQANVAAVYA